MTPQKLASKRGKIITQVDSALEAYHYCVDAGNLILQECRLVCYDTGVTSGSSQIGISLPGRKNEVFNIGKTAIVAPLQLFKHDPELLPLAFDEDDWRGALGNMCVGKELMQSSPNLSEYYEKGEKEKAKELMHASEIEIYHNICLASYVRSRSLHVNEGQTRRNDGVLSWVNVSTVLNKNREKNNPVFDNWSNVAYRYNPNFETMKSMLEQEHQKILDATKVPVKANTQLLPLLSVQSRRSDGREEEKTSEEADRVHLRTLVVPIHFMGLLRCLMDFRRNSLDQTITLVDAWVKKHSRDRKERTQQMFELHKELNEEKQILETLTKLLPTVECIKSFLQLNPEDQDDKNLKSNKGDEAHNLNT